MLDDHSELAFVILIFGFGYLFSLKFYPELARFLLVAGGARPRSFFVRLD